MWGESERREVVRCMRLPTPLTLVDKRFRTNSRRKIAPFCDRCRHLSGGDLSLRILDPQMAGGGSSGHFVFVTHHVLCVCILLSPFRLRRFSSFRDFYPVIQFPPHSRYTFPRGSRVGIQYSIFRHECTNRAYSATSPHIGWGEPMSRSSAIQ